MEFFVKNLFSKCEHIRIKLRIYSHLLSKYLNLIGFITEGCKFLFKPNSKSLAYFISLSAQELLHDNQYTFTT